MYSFLNGTRVSALISQTFLTMCVHVRVCRWVFVRVCVCVVGCACVSLGVWVPVQGFAWERRKMLGGGQDVVCLFRRRCCCCCCCCCCYCCCCCCCCWLWCRSQTVVLQSQRYYCDVCVIDFYSCLHAIDVFQSISKFWQKFLSRVTDVFGSLVISQTLPVLDLPRGAVCKLISII